ncbi:hypothetical protein M422DRAFT_27577 [Sphaerobolus stellatus SS14]|nr:hypothetical protein M422DRAFT_27577 [Sphaerobolus stellatus SS14]
MVISIVGSTYSQRGVITGIEDDSMDDAQGERESERKKELDAKIRKCRVEAEEMDIQFTDDYISIVEV